MPTYQALQLPPNYPIGINLEYLEITREFAGGHDKSEIVGPTDGILTLTLNFNLLPSSSQFTVNDPENGGAATPWAIYLIKFFKYRKADGEPFTVNVEDPLTGSTMTQLFKFPPTLSLSLLTYKVFSASGITLRQWRALT